MAACSDWSSLGKNYEGPGICPVYVVAGDGSTCIRKTNGSLYCWGDNRFAELGTGDTVKRPIPERVNTFAEAVSKIYLPSGEGDITTDVGVFGCAILTDSSLWCWGDNRFGQLGLGSTEPQLLPTAVLDLPSNIAKAAIGSGHSCAETVSGDLYCWGRNQTGQLGLGNMDAQMRPVQVPLHGFTVDKLSAGGGYSCVRAPEGTLWCWGANQYGQLGLGDTTLRTQPIQVSALGTNVGRFSTGATHSCAITQDGTVWCWGDNRYGQLGVGDLQQRSTPTQIDPTSLGSVTQVLLGGRHSCALKENGSLWCWGENRFGQLGTGDVDSRLTPVQVAPLILGSDVTVAYAGGAHTCAIKSDGSVYCWGNNQYGQLGVVSVRVSTEPLRVLPPCE